MSTQKKSFAPLPPDQTVGIKAWVRTTEYHRSSKLQAQSTVTFAGGAFRNSTLRLDHESRPPVGLPLHARETLGPRPPPATRSTAPPPSRAAALGAVVPNLEEEQCEIRLHHRWPGDAEARTEGEDRAARFRVCYAAPITARPKVATRKRRAAPLDQGHAAATITGLPARGRAATTLHGPGPSPPCGG